MVNKEAQRKQDKDSQLRRYSVQPRADSRTGSDSPAFVAIKGATD